jgi:hypothetical protein
MADPPLVKLNRPAEYRAESGQPRTITFPKTPTESSHRRPLYPDDRDEIFRIDNVVWRDDGLAFGIVIVPVGPDPGLEPLAQQVVRDRTVGHAGWTPGCMPQDASFVWRAERQRA